MIDIGRRLHPWGPASRGIVADADGVMLGPECVLVERTAVGYRCLSRDDAKRIQDIILAEGARPDWLFEQCQWIVKALDTGQIAFAQILGLQIPVAELDEPQLTRLAAKAALRKANHNRDQPRIPAGHPGGGQWTSDGDDPPDPPHDAADPPQDDGYSDPEADAFDAHLVNVEYPLNQEMWQVARNLYRLYRDGGGGIATLREYLADRGLKIYDLPDVIRSVFDPPKRLRDLQTDKPPRGFGTEAELRAYLGDPHRDTNGIT